MVSNPMATAWRSVARKLMFIEIAA